MKKYAVDLEVTVQGLAEELGYIVYRGYEKPHSIADRGWASGEDKPLTAMERISILEEKVAALAAFAEVTFHRTSPVKAVLVAKKEGD